MGDHAGSGRRLMHVGVTAILSTPDVVRPAWDDVTGDRHLILQADWPGANVTLTTVDVLAPGEKVAVWRAIRDAAEELIRTFEGAAIAAAEEVDDRG